MVTAGRGGKLAVFLNQNGQQFRQVEGLPAGSADQGAIVGWPDGKENRYALVAVSDDGTAPGRESEIAAYTLARMDAPQHWPAGLAEPGPLALADIDGDGDLDLFLGRGRFLPGRYPQPVSSGIWLNEHGELRRSAELSKGFESIGLVSGATFCDLDGDGQPDLALAIEWGPVRLFQNQHGHFRDLTAEWGLGGNERLVDQYHGGRL